MCVCKNVWQTKTGELPTVPNDPIAMPGRLAATRHVFLLMRNAFNRSGQATAVPDNCEWIASV